jgi:hypothetical protein
MVPNMLFDSFLPVVSPAAWKIILFICRKTYGWIDKSTGQRKEWDVLSVSQIVQGTGLSDTGVSETLTQLVKSGLVRRGESTRYGYGYSVNIHCDKKAAIEVLNLKSRAVSRPRKMKNSPYSTQLVHPTQLGANSVGGDFPTQSGLVPELSWDTKDTIKTNPQKNYGAQAALPRLLPERRQTIQVEDPRFQEICEAIRRVWPKFTRCDIDERDAKAIRAYLKRKPDFPGKEIAICIVFRSFSDGENPTLPVRKWIGEVDKYQGGPLNRYRDSVCPPEALDSLRDQAHVVLGSEPAAQGTLAEDQRVHSPADMDYVAGEQAWQFVRTYLKNDLSQHAWDTWIKPLVVIGILRGVLYVRIPSTAFGNLRKKYAKLIEQALAGLASDLILIPCENLSTYDFEKSASQSLMQVEEATA